MWENNLKIGNRSRCQIAVEFEGRYTLPVVEKLADSPERGVVNLLVRGPEGKSTVKPRELSSHVGEVLPA